MLGLSVWREAVLGNRESPADVVVASAADLSWFEGQSTPATAQQVYPQSLVYMDDGVDKFVRFTAVGYPSATDGAAYVRWKRESRDGLYRWRVRIGGTAADPTLHYGSEPYARCTPGATGLTLFSGGPYRFSNTLRQRIRRIIDGTITDLLTSSVSPDAPHNAWYWHEMQVLGNSISSRYYQTTPGAWNTVTDASIPAAPGQYCGIGARLRLNQYCDIRAVHFIPA